MTAYVGIKAISLFAGMPYVLLEPTTTSEITIFNPSSIKGQGQFSYVLPLLSDFKPVKDHLILSCEYSPISNQNLKYGGMKYNRIMIQKLKDKSKPYVKAKILYMDPDNILEDVLDNYIYEMTYGGVDSFPNIDFLSTMYKFVERDMNMLPEIMVSKYSGIEQVYAALVRDIQWYMGKPDPSLADMQADEVLKVDNASET